MFLLWKDEYETRLPTLGCRLSLVSDDTDTEEQMSLVEASAKEAMANIAQSSDWSDWVLAEDEDYHELQSRVAQLEVAHVYTGPL